MEIKSAFDSTVCGDWFSPIKIANFYMKYKRDKKNYWANSISIFMNRTKHVRQI